MKVLVAPTAFKGSLTACEAAAAMAAGARAADAEAQIVELPVSDGGDGLVEAVHRALGGPGGEPVELRTARVSGPLGEEAEPVDASFLWLPERRWAVIEMATASGLARIPSRLAAGRLDPTRTTTRGTGELIRAALDLGVRRVLVGLGGSATVDGGLGAVAALGLRCLDAAGQELEPVGASLSRIRHLDLAGLDPRVAATGTVHFEALCDVTNPLLGPEGAARVYGPQKGATPWQVEELEAGLTHLAGLFAEELERDVRSLPGAGAAGGLGAAHAALLDAALQRGIERVLELLDFDRHLDGTDVVLTAEGRIDEQTVRYGKAPAEVARRAREAGVPCIAFAGSVADPFSGPLGPFTAVVPLCTGSMSERESMVRAGELLTAVTARTLRRPRWSPTRPPVPDPARDPSAP